MADLTFIPLNATPDFENPRLKRAVDRREGGLTAEYTRKAKAVDIVYGGISPDVVGPVQQHLRCYGEAR